MSVTFGWAVLNLAYLVYFASGLFKDILRLRIVWMLATILFMTHGVIASLWPAVWWNIPVLLLHIWMIWSLLAERRDIDLTDEAEAIRTLIFPGLSRVAFNILWHAGEERIVTDEVLITKGEPVQELSLIIDGEVAVAVSNVFSVRLSEYRLIGELSSFTEGPGSATVTALGDVRLRAWDKETLHACGKKHPEIQVAMLQAMGHEAARKVI